jgi:hypothetical protein
VPDHRIGFVGENVDDVSRKGQLVEVECLLLKLNKSSTGILSVRGRLAGSLSAVIHIYEWDVFMRI